MSIDRMLEDLHDEAEERGELELERAMDGGDYRREQDENEAFERSHRQAYEEKFAKAAAEMLTDQLAVACSCCNRRYGLRAFRALPPCSGGGLYMGDGAGNRLELRNCYCGSTLSITSKESGPVAPPLPQEDPPEPVQEAAPAGTLFEKLDAFMADQADREIWELWKELKLELAVARATKLLGGQS